MRIFLAIVLVVDLAVAIWLLCLPPYTSDTEPTLGFQDIQGKPELQPLQLELGKSYQSLFESHRFAGKVAAYLLFFNALAALGGVVWLTSVKQSLAQVASQPGTAAEAGRSTNT